MDNAIQLDWKTFTIPVDKLNDSLKLLFGSDYDGIVCEEDSFYVVFKASPTQIEQDELNNFWNTVTPQQFSPTLRDIISQKINDASVFGRTVILDFAVENVQMGITQANKTRDVSNYCANVQRYLESGSIYAAVAEIDELTAAGVPANLAPFITADRLAIYKARLETWLSS